LVISCDNVDSFETHVSVPQGQYKLCFLPYVTLGSVSLKRYKYTQHINSCASARSSELSRNDGGYRIYNYISAPFYSCFMGIIEWDGRTDGQNDVDRCFTKTQPFLKIIKGHHFN
jgi:hypothetical protein